MTAKAVLELFINANLVLIAGYALWWLLERGLHLGRGRTDYPGQLRLLKTVLLCLALSPLLSVGLTSLGAMLAPGQPLTVGDMAVAAYLRGDIAMPAVTFEAMLTAQNRFLQDVLSGAHPWATALGIALMGGALWQAGRLVQAALRIRRAVAESFLWRRSGSVEIRLSDRVSIPYAARGLRRRYVILPSHLVTQPRVLRFALAHELQHHRQGDLEWELALELLRPLLFWNPAYWLWKRRFDHLRELSCDQMVLIQSRITPREYAHGLLDFCQNRLTAQANDGLRVALLRGGSARAKSALTARIMALQDAPRRARGMAAGFWLALAIFGVGITWTTTSTRQLEDWSHDRLMLSTVVNLERLRQ